MKKIISAIIITMLGFSFLIACGAESDTKEPVAAQEDTTKTSDTKSEPAIDAGVHVDWDAVNSPLWNQDIENKLSATLDAIIQKDANKLNEEVMPDASGAFDYMLKDQYDFKSISDVREEDNKVIVKVDHDVLMAGSDAVQTGGYYYYFEKDGNGKWQLVTID